MAAKVDLTSNADFQRVVSDLRRLNALTIGILIVVTIAAGGLVVNYEAMNQASYENLKDQVLTQNDKIDALTKVLQSEHESTPKTH